jgi:enoyl-CoA hydratase/carnithine racemase
VSGRVSLRRDARPDGLVAHVTVERPEKLNVLDTPTIAALASCSRDLAAEDGLRAVVLSGAGERAWIGGADINEMVGLTPETARAFITRLHACCAAVRALPVPVIARIRGWTLGAGLELAAACDLRIAADDARFGMPEVRIGIPSVIEAALLPRLIGWGRASRLLLTGETIDAARAAAWGLVEEVVPAADLDAAMERVLAGILASGPGAIRAQKRLITGWEGQSLPEAIAAGIDAFAASFETEEPARMMTTALARLRGPAPG